MALATQLRSTQAETNTPLAAVRSLTPKCTGFEFVAYDTREYTTDRKGNPYLDYQEMQAVLSKSLLLYQNGHTGRIPRKIFVHKSSHFTDEEVQGALDAFAGKTEVELVQVVPRSNWYGLKVDQDVGRDRKPGPAGYPVDRGLYLLMTSTECLLWNEGSVMESQRRSSQSACVQGSPTETASRSHPHQAIFRPWWMARHVLKRARHDEGRLEQQHALQDYAGDPRLFPDFRRRSEAISGSVDDVYDYRLFM